MILDCENFDTCIKSLSEILKLPSRTIVSTLVNINMSDKEFRKGFYSDPYEFIIDYFKKELNTKTDFKYTCWFHNSRVKKNTDFKDGILPLNLAIEDIESYLEYLAKSIPNKKGDISENIYPGSAFHYFTKTRDKMHWGPYGFLIRYAALKKIDLLHDYLKLPEIVEDLIKSKYSNICSQLEATYLQNTVSCIVKFKTEISSQDLLGKALYYAYLTIHDEELCLECNTCFDGNAEIIAPERIIKIEYLKDL